MYMVKFKGQIQKLATMLRLHLNIGQRSQLHYSLRIKTLDQPLTRTVTPIVTYDEWRIETPNVIPNYMKTSLIVEVYLGMV